MTEKPKPCPFCGANPRTISDQYYSHNTYYCENDDCSSDGAFKLEEWNNRPVEQKLKDAIQKMLNGINFALDQNFSRKIICIRLVECRKEAIKLLTETKKESNEQTK
jgi:hypothetical protein